MKALAWLVYIVVQIIWLPVSIIGAAWVAYRQLIVSKRLGVSQTAIEIINGRWTMDRFNLRDDPSTVQLAGALPNNSVRGLWLALFPLYLSYRLTGERVLYPLIAEPGHETLANLVMNRSLYFDRIIDRTTADAEQFVVLGAGLDTRCYGNLRKKKLSFFELDQSTTQQLKRKHLQQAGIDATHVHFAEVNFADENWLSALDATPYDPAKRTVFLWEGVTLYLSVSSVRRTLRTLKANAVPGSAVIADIYATRFVDGSYAPGLKSQIALLDLTDEGLGFGVDLTDDGAALTAFVESEGLTLGEAHFMGKHTQRGTYATVVEMTL